MPNRPVKIVVNCVTGEQEIIPLTPEEISLRQQAEAEEASIRATEAAQAATRHALALSAEDKLIALGLTKEEITALLAR